MPILLFLWGLVFSIYQISSTPDRVKNALTTSGIYDTFISDVLKQNEKEAQASEGEKIPTDQPEVKQIIQNAASPEFLKTQVENFLDDAYAWMSGDTPHLQLEIDLTEAKTKLIEGLAQHTTNRLNTMPVCEVSIATTEFDPLTAECLPPGTDKQAAVTKIREEINKQFNDPVITQDDIKKDGSQSLEEQLQAVPKIYGNITLGLWIGALVIALLTAAIIWLSATRRDGLKKAGIVFTTTGAITIVVSLFAAFGLKKAVENLDEGEAQASAINVLHILAEDLRSWWLCFGIIVLALGIAALVGQRYIKPENPVAENAHKPAGDLPPNKPTASLDVPASTSPKSNAKPKNKKPPVKAT